MSDADNGSWRETLSAEQTEEAEFMDRIMAMRCSGGRDVRDGNSLRFIGKTYYSMVGDDADSSDGQSSEGGSSIADASSSDGSDSVSGDSADDDADHDFIDLLIRTLRAQTNIATYRGLCCHAYRGHVPSYFLCEIGNVHVGRQPLRSSLGDSFSFPKSMLREIKIGILTL
jgi:hypothetical protein